MKGSQASNKPKLPEETLKDFLSNFHPSGNSFSIGFENNALLAFAPSDRQYSIHQR